MPAAETLARRRLALVLLALSAAGLLLVAFFDPARWSFYPACPLQTRVGLECAACGTLRALHAMTHGQMGEAFRYNPALVVLSPFLALFLVNEARVLAGRRSWALPRSWSRWIWALVALLVLFILLRNLL